MSSTWVKCSDRLPKNDKCQFVKIAGKSNIFLRHYVASVNKWGYKLPDTKGFVFNDDEEVTEWEDDSQVKAKKAWKPKKGHCYYAEDMGREPHCKRNCSFCKHYSDNVL